MERTTSLSRAKKIMGDNFIGPVELKVIEKKMGIYVPDEVVNRPPSIQFDEDSLEKLKNDYILILGIPYYKDKTPLTIVKMREHFGWDPEKSEPCFYNQDWYIGESFAKDQSLNLGWHLIKTSVNDDFRGKNLEAVLEHLGDNKKLPSAILVSFSFFANYYINKKQFLWGSDYLWCEDVDHNMDQIYVGRYHDPDEINKNGFSIHRFLRIRKNYSIAYEFY
ncbi:MAG: hypothetical protein Q8M94_19255 [Ignavibacteria bacterium]|nr:hypothetical protein [Ignavibacteria bacterium]